MATLQEDGGGDYTGIDTAINGNNETTIEIQETWDNDDETTSTLTVDSGNPTTITTDSDSRNLGFAHDGVGTWYRLRQTASSTHMFTLSDDLTATGVDMKNESTSTSDELWRIALASDITLTDCVSGFDSLTLEQDGMYTDVAGAMVMIFTNCVFYNIDRGLIDYFEAGGDLTVDLNCVSAFNIGSSGDSRHGIVGMRNTADNVVVRSFNSAYRMATGNVQTFPGPSSGNSGNTLTVDRCITSQDDWAAANWNTETITDSLLSRTWTANASPGSGDFVIVESITSPFDLRLQDNATDNDAQDLHADSSGAGLPMPSTDLVGTSRPQPVGGNFDAGIFEVVAAAVGDIAPIVAVAQRRVLTGRLLSM